MERALPTVITIGAMKCGTSALHRYLDAHPHVAMSQPKELNFFFGHGDGSWVRGNWHRGIDWYASHFDPAAPVRGESSPGYTSPDHPESAERMAAVVPDVRLLYLVRDPIDRAVSQWHHHADEGTETRPVEEALLDPGSQYIARGCYDIRLVPFLERFPRERILILSQERLLDDRRATLRTVWDHVGVEEFWSDEFEQRWHTRGGARPTLDGRVRERLEELFRPQRERIQEVAGRPLW